MSASVGDACAIVRTERAGAAACVFLLVPIRGREEVGYQLGGRRRVFQQEQMSAAGRTCSARLGSSGEHAPVHERHDGVVVAGEHERRLP